MTQETISAKEYRRRMGVPPPGWDRQPGGVEVIRLPKPRMNKTETAWASVLATRKSLLEIHDWYFESIKLRLADRTWYAPDFFVFVVPPYGASVRFEVHEVKGHWREDARVKFKVAAELYPCFRFMAVQRVKGEWLEERVGPGWKQ